MYRRGISKPRRRLRLTRRMKFSRVIPGQYRMKKMYALYRRKAGFKPEVKYTILSTTSPLGIAVRYISSSSLSSSDYRTLFEFPAQGTSDTQRLGDTITPVKLWVRIVVNSISNVDSCVVRVIIFTMNQVVSSTISNFFQASTINPAILGVVNREIVNKVYYDKMITLNRSDANNQLAKPRNINIKLRKPIVFYNGSQTPRDPKNIFYIGYMMYIPTATTDSADKGFMNVHTNFYFTDV